MTLLKICGLTRAEDVELVDKVAEYAGFIVDPTTGSPRRIRPEEARELASALGRARAVAVFDKLSAREAVELARRYDFGVAQIPDRVDEELADEASGVGVRVAPVALYGRDDVVAEVGRLSKLGTEYVLVDAVKGSELRYRYGLKLPWDLIERVVGMGKVALAGGINADNVAHLLALNPYMVDVASGVESAPGVKDRDLVMALARRLRKI